VSEELGIAFGFPWFLFQFLSLISFNSELAPRNWPFMAPLSAFQLLSRQKAAFVAKTTAIRALHRFMSYEFHTNCQWI